VLTAFSFYAWFLMLRGPNCLVGFYFFPRILIFFISKVVWSATLAEFPYVFGRGTVADIFLLRIETSLKSPSSSTLYLITAFFFFFFFFPKLAALGVTWMMTDYAAICCILERISLYY
jgi:hypothetical protein